MPVRHCQASDGLRGTESIEASSSSTATEHDAGGFGGRNTTGPGYDADGARRTSDSTGLVVSSESLLGDFSVVGVKFLILFLRMRRPPRLEPPRTHSRCSRTHRWHGGLPGLPLLSLSGISSAITEGNPGKARDLQVASRFALAAVQTSTRDALDDVIGPSMLGCRGL